MMHLDEDNISCFKENCKSCSWRDGYSVMSVCCSLREHRLGSQNSQDCSQLSVTLILETLVSLLTYPGFCIHTLHIYTLKNYHVLLKLSTLKICRVLVVYTFISRTQETAAGGSL